jgi:hypothetical protein
MDEDEFRLAKADWSERLRAIAAEIRETIGKEIAGDSADMELDEIQSALDDAAGDLDALTP